MPDYPNRCQHLKINGTQCASPALRRNRFCFFHKRYQDERIKLNTARSRSSSPTFVLPILEDANSIQMALMQIMRLLLTGQIEHKTASLLLYALQTASANLRLTTFSPDPHKVILNPRDACQTPIDSGVIWEEEDDFEEEEEELNEVEQKAEEAAERARVVARLEAQQEVEARQRALKRSADEEALKRWSEKHPEAMLVRRDGQLVVEYPTAQAPEKKPAATASTSEVRAQITGMVRKALPALSRAYTEALKKEAEKKVT